MMFKALLLALAAAQGVLAYQPHPREVRLGHVHPRDVVNHDAYPFCNVATNPNCIAGGKYLVPILDFSIQRSAGDKAYAKYLPQHNYTLSKWPKGKMPQPCYYWGVTRDYWKPADFTMYNVTFTDCPKSPWVVCLNKKVPRTINQIAKEIGRIPATMRQATSIYMVYGDTQADNPKYGGYMATYAPHGIVIGRNTAYFATSIVHEVNHAVDSNLASPDAPRPGYGSSFSGTDAWHKAVKADGYAVSAYGAGSYVEDFAEAGRAVLLDAIYPGGLKAMTGNNKNLTQITNQLKAFKAVVGGFYKAGGKCDLKRKFPFPTDLVDV